MLEVLPHTALLHCGLAMVVQPPPYLRIWWILCAILVFLMQVGFMLVETGFVRERSMSGIALKTFLMLLASSLAYSVIGYKIMYGSDIFHGLIGWDPSAHDLGMEWQFYQTGFAAVAGPPQHWRIYDARTPLRYPQRQSRVGCDRSADAVLAIPSKARF